MSSRVAHKAAVRAVAKHNAANPHRASLRTQKPKASPHAKAAPRAAAVKEVSRGMPTLGAPVLDQKVPRFSRSRAELTAPPIWPLPLRCALWAFALTSRPNLCNHHLSLLPPLPSDLCLARLQLLFLRASVHPLVLSGRRGSRAARPGPCEIYILCPPAPLVDPSL